MIEYLVQLKKKLLNELAMFLGAVRKFHLSFTILGISESSHFKEIIDFMPFYVLLMFLRLVLK